MAKTLYSAAVDLGATSGRVILGAWANQQLTLTELHRFPNAFRSLNGHDYWDVGGLWHEIQTGLRKLGAALPKGAPLASVGVEQDTPASLLQARRPRLAAEADAVTQRCLATPWDYQLLNCLGSGGSSRVCLSRFEARRTAALGP